MAFFSALGICLTLVFGSIFLGLVGEVYYLLWWKKRINSREIENHYTSIASELSHIFCWKKTNSVKTNNNDQELAASVRISEANGHEQDLEQGTGKDLLLTGFSEECVESELMRRHNLSGPPRFLFTIKEETKEDLESDDGKSKGDRSRKGSRTRSLSDLIIAVDTPFLTPLSSPPIKAHPLDSYSDLGFNPLFESFTEGELTRLRSSPPSKFKFLRDAEEKLMKRLMEEAQKRALKNGGSIHQDSVTKASSYSSGVTEEKDGSLLSFVGKNNAKDQLHHQLPFYHSTPSQVLPLASSPSTFKPFDNNQVVQ